MFLLNFSWNALQHTEVEFFDCNNQADLNTIFVSSHMYPENPEGTQVIVGSMYMGYDIYPSLPGIELETCSIPSACQFH